MRDAVAARVRALRRCWSMAAAVADYRPAAPCSAEAQEAARADAAGARAHRRHPRRSCAGRAGERIVVGFAAETENVIGNARAQAARQAARSDRRQRRRRAATPGSRSRPTPCTLIDAQRAHRRALGQQGRDRRAHPRRGDERCVARAAPRPGTTRCCRCGRAARGGVASRTPCMDAVLPPAPVQPIVGVLCGIAARCSPRRATRSARRSHRSRSPAARHEWTTDDLLPAPRWARRSGAALRRSTTRMAPDESGRVETADQRRWRNAGAPRAGGRSISIPATSICYAWCWQLDQGSPRTVSASAAASIAEPTLHFAHGCFEPWPYTYPDYAEPVRSGSSPARANDARAERELKAAEYGMVGSVATRISALAESTIPSRWRVDASLRHHAGQRLMAGSSCAACAHVRMAARLRRAVVARAARGRMGTAAPAAAAGPLRRR